MRLCSFLFGDISSHKPPSLTVMSIQLHLFSAGVRWLLPATLTAATDVALDRNEQYSSTLVLVFTYVAACCRSLASMSVR